MFLSQLGLNACLIQIFSVSSWSSPCKITCCRNLFGPRGFPGGLCSGGGSNGAGATGRAFGAKVEVEVEVEARNGGRILFPVFVIPFSYLLTEQRNTTV